MSKKHSPVVVCIPYNTRSVSDSVAVLNQVISERDLHLLLNYPTVYLIHCQVDSDKNRFASFSLIYVGETNDIAARTRQHHHEGASPLTKSLEENPWATLRDHTDTRMYVIGHRHFNKSLTLDIENRLMGYVLALGPSTRLRVTNDRPNPQRDYYTHSEFERITSEVWRELRKHDSALFLPESEITDSAVFKASPFHKLTDEQQSAEEFILRQIDVALKAANQRKQLIVVEGAAGTGKTVLLSHLFLEIAKALSRDLQSWSNETEELLTGGVEGRLALIVNHDEQETVYNSIAKRLGLQRRQGEIVFKGTEFINRYSENPEEYRHIHGLEHQKHPSEEVEVVLIDEAHLLFNSGNQGYVGHRNQLWDIMERARVVVAVYDSDQVLRKSQELTAEMKDILFVEGESYKGNHHNVVRRKEVSAFDACIDVTNIVLETQFRIDACDEIIQWIDDFAAGRGIGPIPADSRDDDKTPYEIRVFESPLTLYDAIVEKNNEQSTGLSRLVCTYDWAYAKNSRPQGNPDAYWSVSLRRTEGIWEYSSEYAREHEMAQTDTDPDHFCIPWNYQLPTPNRRRRLFEESWAERPHTIGEAGSIYTIQGFDLNYAGVILGPSVQWRDERLVFDPRQSKNKQAIEGSAHPEENLRHELNVLLKRGVHGLYLFAVDHELQNHLQRMANVPQVT